MDRLAPVEAALDHRGFRDALGKFATGITVVTAVGPDGPVGITVNSFSSVSLDPPLVLWSIDKGSRRRPAFEASPVCAIHVLGDDQAETCKAFTKDVAPFDSLPTTHRADGLPLLEGCLARFECTPYATYDGGDHLIMVVEVAQVTMRDAEPLVFFDGAFRTLTKGLD